MLKGTNETYEKYIFTWTSERVDTENEFFLFKFHSIDPYSINTDDVYATCVRRRLWPDCIARSR